MFVSPSSARSHEPDGFGIAFIYAALRSRALGRPCAVGSSVDQPRLPEPKISGAGPRRMRPVVMMQLATVFGMIPIAIADSQGTEARNVMGMLAIGGILSSTFLMLLIVPVAHSLMPDAYAGSIGCAGASHSWHAEALIPPNEVAAGDTA